MGEGIVSAPVGRLGSEPQVRRPIRGARQTDGSELTRPDVLLIPGFCEPRSLLWPMAWTARRHAAQVRIWRDRYLFRSLPASVQRLRGALQSNGESSIPLVVITHSFGDWVLRQAMADLSEHRVTGIVSLAPVMRALPLARLARLGGLGVVPEVPVMSDAVRAGEHLEHCSHLDHLVVWAALDWLVPAAKLPASDRREIRRVVATHLSIVLQPNVHAIVSEFLRRHRPAR